MDHTKQSNKVKAEQDLDGETVGLGVVHRDEEHAGRLRLVRQLKSREINISVISAIQLVSRENNISDTREKIKLLLEIFTENYYFLPSLLRLISLLLLMSILTNLFMIVCCWEELRVCRDVTKFKSSSLRTSLEDILQESLGCLHNL